ncbi:hypothetical protein [Bythopirellula polymerisocia]|uniref:Response regulatory domain-containing protein n=1 Tax=Bythopirellula polymerisocia TaxID=2528003 RepID=A0A5C6CQ22_9BACT|nr:hypothetical protein [Bythopirellula polymerisocia]TWU25521.1 hypothetical protein Pla144_27260 [Bythopirellula polymerisocia]
MPIVLVSRDLMLSSKLEGVARSLGQTLKSVGSGAAALGNAEERQVIVVDLELPGLDIAALVKGIKNRTQQPDKVIAYAPHVRTEKLAAAKEAGCDLVVSRGQIMSDAESILRRFLETDNPQN